jgi:hypothetical protein
LSILEVLAALGIVLLSVGIGFALGEYKTVIPIPEYPKLSLTSSYTRDVLVNPSQILWIEVGDGGPNSSLIHFIGGGTLSIDSPPMRWLQ